MSALVTTFVAALSAFAAVASLLLYVYFGRRTDLAAAREEALALAETRREVIAELRARVASLEARYKRADADSRRRTRELQAALDKARRQAREDAYQTQHFYAAALSDLLVDLRADLERAPPDVDSALNRIRKMLADQRPAA
jgi:phage terminase small subunit